MAWALTQVAADTAIKTTSGYVCMVSVTAAGDAASVILKDGGTGGTAVLTVKAAIGLTESVTIPGGAFLTQGIFATVSGTAPAVSIAWK